jgi:hypothetical protein
MAGFCKQSWVLVDREARKCLLFCFSPSSATAPLLVLHVHTASIRLVRLLDPGVVTVSPYRSGFAAV